MMSLSEQRKLSVSKYVIRSIAVINSVTEDIFIDWNRLSQKSSKHAIYSANQKLYKRVD